MIKQLLKLLREQTQLGVLVGIEAIELSIIMLVDELRESSNYLVVQSLEGDVGKLREKRNGLKAEITELETEDDNKANDIQGLTSMVALLVKECDEANELAKNIDWARESDNEQSKTEIERLVAALQTSGKRGDDLQIDLTRAREVNLHNFQESMQAVYDIAQDWRKADKEVSRLRELFFEYARHIWCCDHELKSCDCGFEKALATLHEVK